MVGEKHDADGGRVAAGTAVGGCATYPTYSYGYGRAYGYCPMLTGYTRTVRLSGPPQLPIAIRPVYSPDYNSSFDTYRSNGGGNG